MKRLRVYVAGPMYSSGNINANVGHALNVADDLMAQGHYPYVPHLDHFWDFYSAHPVSEWLALDLAWLSRCDVMVLLPGYSAGAELEEKEARRLGIHVYEYPDLPEAFNE